MVSSARTYTDEVAHKKRSHGPTQATYELDWTDPARMKNQDLLDFILGQYEAGKNRRRGWESQAAQQLAWLRGNQNLRWSNETNDLRPYVDENTSIESRDPVIINRLKGFVLAWMGMTMGAGPLEWTTNPVTRDPDDVAAANIQRKVLDHVWGSGDKSGARRMMEMAWEMWGTGIVWLKPTWDPRRGSIDTFTAEMMKERGQSPESDRQRRKMMNRWTGWLKSLGREPDKQGKLELPRGGIFLDYASGFDLTEPAYVTSPENCPWLIHSQFQKVEWARERWPDHKDKLVADDPSERMRHLHDELYGWGSFSGHGRRDYTGNEQVGADAPSDEILIHEFWRPVSMSAPHGVLVSCSEYHLLQKGPHPYLHGRLPFIPLQEQPDPKHFRPGCTVRDLMTLQSARNRHRSMSNGHIEATVDPRILVDPNAGLPDGALESGRGPRVIRLTQDGGANKIGVLELPAMPAEMHATDDRNDRDMDQVANVHRSTQGRAESGQQSARHAEAMFQSDARQQSVSRQLIQAGYGEAGCQALWLAWEFMKKETAWQIGGSESGYEVMTWKGDDLSPKHAPFGPFAFNVECTLAKVADANTITNTIEGLTKGGWLRPDIPQHHVLVHRLMGERVPAEMDPHRDTRSRAESENAELRDGKDVPLSLGDDDQVHIDAHMRETTRTEFRAAMGRNPDIVVHMEKHITAHYFQQSQKKLEPALIEQAMKERLALEYGLVPEGGAAQGGAPRAGAPVPTEDLAPRGAGSPAQPGQPQAARMSA